MSLAARLASLFRRPVRWTEADWRRYRRAGGVVTPGLWSRATPEARGAAVKAGYVLLAEEVTALTLAARDGAPGAPVPAPAPPDAPEVVPEAAGPRAALRAAAEGVLTDLRTVAVGGRRSGAIP